MNQRQDVRVVMCAPGFPASNDDADKPFLLDHAKALVAHGVSVSVISPAVDGLPSRQIIDGVNIRRVRYGPRKMETLAATGSMYREARGVKALLAIPMIVALCAAMWVETRKKPVILYGHWWIPGGLVATLVGSIKGCPSVVHLHGSDAMVTTNRFLKIIARWVLRNAEIRLAVSDELATWGEELSGRKFDVLPMPLNFGRLPGPSPVPEQGFVLAVGRLVPEKGFDVLLKAVGLIESTSRPPVTIIGIGPERKNLASQARRLGVELDLPGAIPPREMSDWYSRCRLVSVPSLREGFGLVAAEAASAGRAVVASAVGGIPQVVSHGSSGMHVQPGNVEELAAALQNVDPRWGVNGPERVAGLGMASHAEILNQLFDGLLE